jgi:NAD+ kinase
LDPAKSRKGGIEVERTPRDGLSFSAESIPDINEQLFSRSPIMPISEQTLKSPCFVHSQLEKGASLVDWLKHSNVNGVPVNLSKSLSAGASGHTESTSSAILHEDEEDDLFSGSLTRQLAETAVGVREMSKALGEWLDLGVTVPELTIPHQVVHGCIPIYIVF